MNTSNGTNEPTPRRKAKPSAESTLELAGLSEPAAPASNEAPHRADEPLASGAESEAVPSKAAEDAPEVRAQGGGEAPAEGATEGPAAEPPPSGAEAGEAPSGGSEPPAASADDATAQEGTPRNDRRRIEEQLEALKRRESELRRALAIADHPELADAIRLLEGCVYSVSRVDEKIAQGLSKSEERRRETLEKKVAGLREKRAELDTQIAELEGELAQLGEERTRAFLAERRDAMERLVATLGAHDGPLRAAGLEAGALVPQIAEWMPEIRGLAEELVAARRGGQA